MLKRLTPSEQPSDEPDRSVEDIELSNETLGTAAAEENIEEGIDEFEEEAAPVWLDTNSQAFLTSLILHTIIILGLALIPMLHRIDEQSVPLSSLPEADSEEINSVEDFAISEETQEVIGANSMAEGTTMALSSAPIVAELSEVASPTEGVAPLDTTFNVNMEIKQSIGLVRSETVVKGMTGVGATGTDGAVDRITYEILRSMEERPTLVVWFFDQSGSLQRRRQEIRDRFDRIYEELGIIRKSQEEQGKVKVNDEPLLTSVFAFGDKVSLLTPQPTADLTEIRAAIDSIEEDTTGHEKVFSAIYKAVDKYKSYRSSKTGHGAERNVLFIAVTDERGDDPQGLDVTINQCRKYAIPVYVVGVPAPFGREFTYVKYVDPDPKFDQSPQWAQVDQGPESLMPERVKIGYRDNFYEEPVIDSGFGPYALSRLTYETGGIYFTVHPNRKFGKRVTRNEIDAFAADLEYFFDPEVMAKYRPDYVSEEEYKKKVAASPLRQILIQASGLAAAETLQAPTVRFVKRDEASLANALTAAQQQAARLEPQLSALGQLLMTGAPHREKEASPRWTAGYDLAVGTVLAHKVRAEAYNAMLAKAKRGMVFQNPKNNTWVLKPDDEISVGSKLEKEAATAKKALEEVAKRHAGTPWGLLATRELNNPIGWKWVEELTDLDPPRRAGPGNNNNNVPRPAQDDKARMLAPQAPKRPIPKL